MVNLQKIDIMAKMFVHIGLLLMVFANVKTNEHKHQLVYNNVPVEDDYFWRMDHYSPVNKRQAIQTPQENIQHEDIKTLGSGNLQQVATQNDSKPIPVNNDGAKQIDSKLIPANNDGAKSASVPLKSTVKLDTNNQTKNNNTEPPKETASVNTSPVNASTQIAESAIKSETTAIPTDSVNITPLNRPGVIKRFLIVFSGFALIAVAYFIFYRRKGKNYESNNTHNNNDTNQFRYGVLQSEEGRDNLELSRIPLTMESDDDDEDDLEIFDLEQKKKSLSYVNLQLNDEDIVFHNSKDESKNNLLLDIEDGPSDMINWSNASNKSIL